jgi:hypothetical protein
VVVYQDDLVAARQLGLQGVEDPGELARVVAARDDH